MATQTAPPETSSALDPSTVPATVPSTGGAIGSLDSLNSQAQPSRDLASSGLLLNDLMAKSVVKGHIPGHTCKVCERTRARIAAGKPSKKDMEKARADRKVAKLAAKQIAAARKNGLAEGILVGQVDAGKLPSVAPAVRVSGLAPDKVRDMTQGNLVQSSLEKNGITLDLLDEVGREGLKAESQKLIFDDEGNVADAIAMPDHHARHKFWRDYNMMHGRLGNDRDSQVASGGLVIIAPQEAMVVKGHPPTCVCEECILAWNEKTKVLSRNASRAMAIDAELVENPRPLPENLESEDQGDGDEADESWAPSSS
jgi:hypothetical protein